MFVKTFITWHPTQIDKGSKWQQWQQRPFSSQPPVFGGRQKSLPWNCWNWRCRWALPSFLASSLSWQRQHRQLQRCDMPPRQPSLQGTWSTAEGKRFNMWDWRKHLEDISCHKVGKSGTNVPQCRDDEDPDRASFVGCLVGDGGVGGQEQPRLAPTQLVDDVKPKPFYNLMVKVWTKVKMWDWPNPQGYNWARQREWRGSFRWCKEAKFSSFLLCRTCKLSWFEDLLSAHSPRPKENDDKDEWDCLENQSSRVELLDSRLNFLLLGRVVPICEILTHLHREEVRYGLILGYNSLVYRFFGENVVFGLGLFIKVNCCQQFVGHDYVFKIPTLSLFFLGFEVILQKRHFCRFRVWNHFFFNFTKSLRIEVQLFYILIMPFFLEILIFELHTRRSAHCALFVSCYERIVSPLS